MNYKELFEKFNILTTDDLFNFINDNIKYGWLDSFGQKHGGVNDALNYSLQKPEELIESKLGICWDVTELCRCFFHHMTNLKFETYYIFYDDNEGCPSHSILVYYDNNSVYWFEPFNDISCGVFVFDRIEDLLTNVIKVFLNKLIFNNSITNNFDISKVFVYKYLIPRYHINGFEMRNHINLSEKIEVNYDRKSL